MAVDVVTEAVLQHPREVVAAFAGDPTNAPRWNANIDEVAWLTPPPLAVGSRMMFRARTRMVLRNRGESSGFGALTAPALSAAMRRANRKDLARLAEVLGRP